LLIDQKPEPAEKAEGNGGCRKPGEPRHSLPNQQSSISNHQSPHPLAFSEEFFIHIEGKQKGPYTFPQLKRLYDTNLIPEATLYWREGMEHLEAVADLCGTRGRSRLRNLKQLRLTVLVLAAAALLLGLLFGPALRDAWRELNERDCTPEEAYWKARAFVREEVKKQDRSVAFEPFKSASVTLTGTEATVILPGTLFGKDPTGTKMTWQVAIEYDGQRREWRLPGR